MTKFCPSLMCSDLSNLKHEIESLENAGADMFHIDIMDGHFVPNFSMGLEDIKAVKKISSIPFDVHLMITNPDAYIDLFVNSGCQLIYIHAEVPIHLHSSLLKIQQSGIQVGVAINPATPLCILEEILHLVDVVLVMSVNPGFARQAFIPESIDRVKRLSHMIKTKGCKTKIALDGAINADIVSQLHHEVEYFILGTSGLFGRDQSYKQALDNLKQLTLTKQRVN